MGRSSWLAIAASVIVLGGELACKVHRGTRADGGDAAIRCPVVRDGVVSVVDEGTPARRFIESQGIAFDTFWKVPQSDSGCIVSAFVRQVQALGSARSGDSEVDLMREHMNDYFFECAGIVVRQRRQYVCNAVDSRGGPPGPQTGTFTNALGGGLKVVLMVLDSKFEVREFQSNGDI